MAEESKGASLPAQKPETGNVSKLKAWMRLLTNRRKAAAEGLRQGNEKEMKFQGISIYIAISISVGVVILLGSLRPRLMESYNKLLAQKVPAYKTYLKQAETLAKKHTIRKKTFQEAFKCLQIAIKKAETREAKSEAGLAMGRLLATYARQEPKPYALMAKQYLEAVLDIEQRPDARLQACFELINAAYLLKDTETIAKVSDEALEMVKNKDDKARILLVRMEVFLEKGSWSDMQKLLAMCEPYRSDSRWQYEFAMKKAIANEQTLMRDDWFQDRLESVEDGRDMGPGTEMTDPDSMRSDLFKKTVGQFVTLVNSGIELLATESLFRIARLYFQEGQYGQAEKFFEKFLAHEPTGYQAETLLMMTTIARKQGRMEEAEEMIATFLSNFSWNETATQEFLQIINEGIDNGRFEQTLDLIEKYVNLPLAQPELSELLYKAGQLAGILEQYDRAEEHFKKVIARNDRNDLIVNAMLGLAEIHFKRNDAEGARHWLLAYLNRFPYDMRHNDALFDLLDLSLKKEANVAEIIHIAITAANECPEDSRTIGALLLAAKKLEAIGLHDLAEKQYNKIALLHFIGKSDNQSIGIDKAKGSLILQAILGNARCLIKAGKRENANYLLRKLCHSFQPGELHSEAAYLWALLAMDDEQRVEAIRRLKLINEQTAPSEMATRATIERKGLEMTDQYSREAIITMVKKLAKLSSEEHGEFIRETFMACFNQLSQRRDIENMQKIFNIAFNVDIAEEFPWQELILRIGRVILEDRGIGPFIEYMETTRNLLESGGIEVPDNTSALIQQARDIERYRQIIASHLPTKL